MIEDVEEGDFGETAEGIVGGEFGALDGGAGETAEEAGDLASGAEGGAAFGDEGVDGGDVVGGDGWDGGGGEGEWCGGRVEAVGAVAAGSGKGFAEVGEETSGETAVVEETGDDVVESGEVLLFAGGEASGHGGGDAGGLEVVGETPVGEPAVGELEDGVAVLFEP